MSNRNSTSFSSSSSQSMKSTAVTRERAVDDSHTTFSGTSSSRTYVKPSIPHRNPRQHEIWELQTTHLNRLNYLHFKARLEDDFDWRSSGHTSSNFSSQLSAEHRNLEIEEQRLTETLQQEKQLLEDAKVNTQLEIDRCKKMLEEFRNERKKKLSEKHSENDSRKKLYEEELESLKTMIINEKSDIKVSIHQIDYMSKPDAEDVSALNNSYDLREQILRTQADSLHTKSSLTNKNSSSSKASSSKSASPNSSQHRSSKNSLNKTSSNTTSSKTTSTKSTSSVKKSKQ